MLDRLAALLTELRFENFSELTVRKTCTALQNHIGICFPALESTATKAEAAFWRESGTTGSSVIVGYRGKASALAAAAVNGTMGDLYDMEDMHYPTSSHPGSVIIPVAMAVGDEVNASGKEVIEAIVAGYEAMGRIGAALLLPGFSDNGLRPGSILVPFGGAVTAARLMGLDKDGIRRAMAIAGQTSSGLLEFSNAGTDDLCVHSCFAARNSIFAAQMAARGVKASPTVLEGRFGLGWAYNDRACDWERMFEERKAGGCVIDETVIKRFPACGYIQCSAEAIIGLISKTEIDPARVDHIECRVAHAFKYWAGVDDPGPFGGAYGAMMSHQFTIATALLRREISVDGIDHYDDPRILELTGRITVEEDKNITASGKPGCQVVVYMQDGTVHENTIADITFLSQEEVRERTRGLAAERISAERTEEILSKCEALDRLSSIRELSALLEGEL